MRKLIACTLASLALMAAASDTAIGIFAPDFHSLRTVIADSPTAPAVILLGEQNVLTIEFDQIAEDPQYLRYRLIHCSADWEPDGLVESEYIDGFNQAEVTDYAISNQTLTHYVNYRITLPNENMNPLLSGNYLLQVFPEDDPNMTLLQTRFMVVEPLSILKADLTSRTDIDYNGRHQQLSVEAAMSDAAAVADPFNDLKLVIVQNGRPDMTRTLDKPLRIAPTKAIYEHLPQLIFPAGNEYRRFETTNVRYPGRGVEQYIFAEPFYHADLQTDTPRSGRRYEYDRDQSGRFFPDEINSTDASVQADYVVTHFTLQMPEIPGADIYIDSDAVCRRDDSTSHMAYDPVAGAYVKALLLKQGLYNYQYLAKQPGSDSLTAPIEGDYYETQNEYLLLLYHRPPMGRYDRLIGTLVLAP